MNATHRTTHGAARATGGARLVLVLLLAAVALLYWNTLYPGVGGRINPGDSAKFQYIGQILGVPHQPGYPQYLALNHLWTRLPLPLELAERINLLSSVFALGAGVFLFLFVRRLTGSLPAAALATATVLLGRIVWTFSTEAEVYSLNLLYLCAVLWAAEHWRRSREWRWLAALVAIYGLSFGNHPLMITLLPGLLVLLVRTDLKAVLRPRTLLFGAAILALTLSQYGLLVWRANSGVEVVEGISREAEFTDVTRTLRAERFVDEYMLREGVGAALERGVATVGEAIEQLAVVGVVFAVLGFSFLLRHRAVRGWLLLLTAAVTAAFAAVYQIGDWRLYLAPVFVALAAAAAVGVTHALDSPRERRLAMTAWLIGLLVMAAGNASSLREESNPWDRSQVIDAAPAGARVVTYAGPGYAATQLNRYYRLGLGVEESRGVELTTAALHFERRHTYLDDGETYFQHPSVKEQFDLHAVDYVTSFLPGEAANRHVFRTGVRHPLRQLRAVPADPGMTVETGDGKLLAVPQEGAGVIVVDPRRGRVRGVVPLYRQRTESLPDPLVGDRLLAAVPPGDWVAVLFQGQALQGSTRRAVEKVAEYLGLDGSVLPAAARAVLLAGPARGDGSAARCVADPPEPVTIAIGTEGAGG